MRSVTMMVTASMKTANEPPESDANDHQAELDRGFSIFQIAFG